MKSENRRSAYPLVFHILPFVSPIGLVIWTQAPQWPAMLLHILGITAAIILLVSYIYQLWYLYSTLHKRLLGQLLLVCAAFLLPFAGAALGDAAGRAAFGGDAQGAQLFNLGLAGGLTIGVFILNLYAIGNVITIATGGQKSSLRILGIVGQVILWIAVGIASYVMYALLYTLRDPSTE